MHPQAWDGRSRGAVWGYQLFVWLLRVLPLWVPYTVLVFVSGFYLLVEGKARAASWHLFRHRLGRSRWQAYWLVYRNFYVFSQVLVDRLGMLAGIDKGFRFQFNGEQHLHHLVATQQSALLIGGHLGAWEMASQQLAGIGASLHVVLFDNENSALKTYLSRLHNARSFHTIPIRQDLSHVFAIQNVVRAGGLLCLHGDRYLPGSTTRSTQFLGRPAQFPEGPFRMAVRLGLPVSFVHAVKTGWRNYDLYASEPVIAQNTTELFQAYTAQLERMLQQHPTQWFNFYDFWADTTATNHG